MENLEKNYLNFLDYLSHRQKMELKTESKSNLPCPFRLFSILVVIEVNIKYVGRFVFHLNF